MLMILFYIFTRYTGLYARENRNLRRVRCKDRRNKLIVQGRAAIGAFLSDLPHTTHDAGSFIVDIPVAEVTNSLLTFTIH